MHRFPRFGVRNADDHGFFNALMAVEHFFYFARIDIVSADENHIFFCRRYKNNRLRRASPNHPCTASRLSARAPSPRASCNSLSSHSALSRSILPLDGRAIRVRAYRRLYFRHVKYSSRSSRAFSPVKRIKTSNRRRFRKSVSLQNGDVKGLFKRLQQSDRHGGPA